jgi:predicted nucleotidyltransferase
VAERLVAAIEPLLAALRAVERWSQESGTAVVIVGGVAASLLGRPRLTRDVDALISAPPPLWPALLAAAARHDLMPRIDDALGFAERTRVLLLRHMGSDIDVDVILGSLRFEVEAIAHALPVHLRDTTVRLPRVEDLLIMKAIAARPRDIADIEGLLATHPEADLGRVRAFVAEFSQAAERPDLAVEFERLLARLGV